RALLIFLHEVQAEIDQRQKNKIGEKAIGEAEEFHGVVRSIVDAAFAAIRTTWVKNRCAQISALTAPLAIAVLVHCNFAPARRCGDWWCARRDSNPHDFTHCHLKAARLPIPPRALKEIDLPRSGPDNSTARM